MRKQVTLSILLMMFGFLAVQAQATPKVDQRQKNQKLRIVDGVRDGELTRAETANLAKDQRELRRMERRAKRDGKVTARERARLQRKANKNSRKIARKKNNENSRS